MKSDEQLMQEYKSGSPQAFEDLFHRYRAPVSGFFRRRLNNAARAEELAQEAFLIVLRGSEHYEIKAKFRTYLYSIAVKQLWSERRRESRQEKLAAESRQESALADPSTTLWIRDALDQLDLDHREVLMLREYEELSYDEISEVLVVPVNTVRSRLSRARAQLKSILEAQSAKEVSR